MKGWGKDALWKLVQKALADLNSNPTPDNEERVQLLCKYKIQNQKK